MKRVLLSWSSGKDSAWALHVLHQNTEVEIAGLLTTCNQQAGRVAMHGVRQQLLEMQAQAAGLPLWNVPLPWPCSNQQYEAAMRACCQRAVSAGIDAIAFGDLFLTEVREYRERQLQGSGLEPLFPLWGQPTRELALRMIASGLRALLTCVDTAQIPSHFAGREYTLDLLSELPDGSDPCGERGEFHTFACAGPMFQHEIPVQVGAIVAREQFVFADLLPAGIPAQAGSAIH